MILEEETFKAFDYYPSALAPQSNKRILAACDNCGKVRECRKGNYHALCKSCSLKDFNRDYWQKLITDKLYRTIIGWDV